MNQGVMVGGRRPLVEDDLRWKTTSVGRRPLEKDDLWWKRTFGGRQPSLVTPPLESHCTTEPKPELSQQKKEFAIVEK